jgi:hypothetical protein
MLTSRQDDTKKPLKGVCRQQGNCKTLSNIFLEKIVQKNCFSNKLYDGLIKLIFTNKIKSIYEQKNVLEIEIFSNQIKTFRNSTKGN